VIAGKRPSPNSRVTRGHLRIAAIWNQSIPKKALHAPCIAQVSRVYHHGRASAWLLNRRLRPPAFSLLRTEVFYSHLHSACCAPRKGELSVGGLVRSENSLS
jgi:hypothetical protein